MTAEATVSTTSVTDPIDVRGLRIRNRIWIAPMCQYSVMAYDGVPTDWHRVHYGALAAIEPTYTLYVDADTDNAHDDDDNSYLHVGETLYLKHSNEKGVGVITRVTGEDYIVESVSPVMDLWDADRLASANPIDVSPGYVGLFRAVVSRGGAEFPVVVDPKIAREGVRGGKCPGADGFQVGDIRALVERDVLASCKSRGVRPLSVEFHACGGVAYGRLEEGGPYAALASGSHYEYSDYYEENMGRALGFKVNAGPAVTSDTARVLVMFDDDVPSSALAGIAGEFGARASSAGPGAGGRLLLVLASVPDGVSREVLSRLAGDFDNGFDFANQKDARVLKKDLAGLDALPDYVDNGYQYVFAYEDLASAMVCWNSEGGWTSCVL